VNFDTLTVHYTATYEDQDVDIADIDRWHRNQGYAGVGYHRYVKRSGLVQFGRSLSRTGAHVKNQNTKNLGICYEGGLKRATGKDVGDDTRTPAQKVELEKMIREFLNQFPTIKRVVGHKDLAKTQCPGFDVGAWWAATTRGLYVAAPGSTWTNAPVASYPVLFRGVKNQKRKVAELQGYMWRLGWPLVVDGIFGEKTENAVKAFEVGNKLVPDGRVGTAEWIEILKQINR
jgi:N-acetylmuramoyl-L-alanine amidase